MTNYNLRKTESAEQKYNYKLNRVLSSTKEGSCYTDFTSFIDGKIKEKMDERGERITKKDLAQNIGISYEMLKKIINGSKNTRNRDCIIAICVSLNLSLVETNEALELYTMARLNDKNLRDLVIIHSILGNETVQVLNTLLENNNFSCLKLGATGAKQARDSEFYYPIANSRYKVLHKEVTTYDFFEDTRKKSLKKLYDPRRFDYAGSMILEDEEGKKLKLSLDSTYEIYEQNDSGAFKFRTFYMELDECRDPELLYHFLEIESLIDKEAKQVVLMLDDTRNYITRTGVDIIDDKLNCYAERFNYEYPELHEYYQLEVINESYRFSVSRRSRFMKLYLKESYSQFFGKASDESIESYGSLKELELKQSNEHDVYQKVVWDLKIQYFKKLQTDIVETVSDLKQRKIFIQNRELLDLEDIIKAYHVEKEFNCIVDDVTRILEPQIDSYENSEGIVITLDDLFRAFELGIRTIQDISRIKINQKSLEAVLQITRLT